MKTLKLMTLVILAVIFAGCQQKLKEDDVKKGVEDMFSSLKKNGTTEKTLSQFVDGYDKLDANTKEKMLTAFTGQDFQIAKIEGDKVTIDISFSPSDGGQLMVKTVIFKVIEVDGKIRVKDIINVIDNGSKATSSGPDEDVITDDETDLDNLSEEHD